MPGDSNDEIRTSLEQHLKAWGLRRFTSDRDYFAWQQRTFSRNDLDALHRAVETRRQGGSAADQAFYDLTAQPSLIPALYSQRYDYYLEVGSRISAVLDPDQPILDAGCGIGILTTFYAAQHPTCWVIGIDRSSASIDQARRRAKELGLDNVRFECYDLEKDALPERYPAVIATHVLFQSERDLGVPSRSWATFDRDSDPLTQEAFEARTGIGPRLDRLSVALAPGGRAILFEKARLLSRRIPFQRALAARGLFPLLRPEPIRYASVEEITEDGPLYILSRGPASFLWDEQPEPDEGAQLDLSAIMQARGTDEAPLYENHWPSAQAAWAQLPARQVVREVTRDEADGRQLHVEQGLSGDLMYLYVANTFDQRQLVVVEAARRGMLEQYYREIVGENS
ncbi:MAG: methyltransferase domain-containing protein [Nitrospira sp.]|nr:methyltransferase domain-containing protein [Nitrospira sp.]